MEVFGTVLVGVFTSVITLVVVIVQTIHQRRCMLTKNSFERDMVILKETLEKETLLIRENMDKEMVLLKEDISELEEMNDAVLECKRRLYPILIKTIQIFSKNKTEITGADLYLFKRKYSLLVNELLLYMSDEMLAEHKRFTRAFNVFDRTVEARKMPSDQIMMDLWRAKDSFLRAIRKDSPRRRAETLRSSFPPPPPGEPDMTEFENIEDWTSELVTLDNIARLKI